jgi:hypothetical protein
MTPSAPVTVVNVGREDPEVVRASWRLLRERVYPAHGPVRAMEEYSI